MGSPDPLGQLILRHLLARPEDVQAALEAQAAERARGAPLRSIGEILVERGVLTRPQLELVLEEQKRGSRLGPFEILARLGEGGMGVVYKGRPSSGGAAVALKVLSRRYSGSPEVVDRFRREAAIGRTLDHPHIVRTLAFGEDRGNHYIALELMEGGDLGLRLRQGGALPESEALGICRQMADALQHAHERGLVHRDVKPSNIMFAADGTAKLSDFGLVKSLDPEASRLTLDGAALGTPHYISPEQALGEKDIDVRADVYSLGATLYHLVTGQPPFDGGTPIEVIQKHLHEKLTPPDEIAPSLSDGCVGVIERMMAKERGDRYATPAELAADLDRVLAGEEPRVEAIDDARSSLRRSQRRRERLRRRPGIHSTRRIPVRRPSRAPLLWAGFAGAAVFAVAVAAAFAGRSKPPAPAPPLVVRRPPPPPSPPPVSPRPSPPEPPPRPSEEQARAELKALLRDGGDPAKLEAFIRAYDGTFAAAEARAAVNARRKPIPPSPPVPATEAEWTSIFNGRDLDGWHRAMDRVTAVDGTMLFEDRGEAMRRVETADLELRGRWRIEDFGQQGAGAIFVRQPRLERGGPLLVMHHDGDVHLKDRDWSTVAKSGPGQARIGQWQHFLVRARGRTVELELDGKPAVRGEVTYLEGGWLGFYAFNGSRFRVADLELR